MTAFSWKDNEVAASYERNLALLEAARREYGEAVCSFFDGLQKNLKPQQLSDEEPPLRVEFVREGEAFHALIRGDVRFGDVSTGLSVVVRAGAPYGGPPSTLQLGAAYLPNGETVATSLEAMRQLVSEKDSTGNIALEPNWLFAKECPISAQALIVETVVEFSRSLIPFAFGLRDEISCLNKVLGVFQSVFSRLPFVDGFGSPTKVSFPRTPWRGMRYVEIEFASYPRLWVGYHVEWGKLMFGHHEKPGEPSFAHQFYSEVGATGHQRHDKYPAGTLLDMAAVRGASPEELEVICLETFGRYLAFARDYDARQTSSDVPLPPP